MEKAELIRIKGAEAHYFGKRAVRMTAIISALLLAVLFSVAFALDFDVKRAFFENGSVIAGIAFYAALALPAVIMIITPILVKSEASAESVIPAENEYKKYYTLDNSLVRIVRIIAAAVIAAQAVVREIASVISGGGILMSVVTFLLSLCLALYFVPELTDMMKIRSEIHTVFGMLSLLWLLINIVDTYLQRDFALSSEYFMLAEIGYILTLLALTYEMRYHLDGGYLRARLATSCAAFAFGFGFCMGRIAMLVTHGQVSFEDTALALAMLVISLYFGTRIVFYEED